MTAVTSEGGQLSIGQVAERTGLSVHALRFYEREGILAEPVRRDAGGRRLYDEGDVDWLTLCVKLRSSGMPLASLRRYAELVREGPGNEDERLSLLRAHQDRIRTQIDDLGAALEMITFKVGLYADRLERDTSDPIWQPGQAGGRLDQ